jgi:hypothetical protein
MFIPYFMRISTWYLKYVIRPELVQYIVRGCHRRSFQLKVLWCYNLFDNTWSCIVLLKCLWFIRIYVEYLCKYVEHSNFILFINDIIVDKISLFTNMLFCFMFRSFTIMTCFIFIADCRYEYLETQIYVWWGVYKKNVSVFITILRVALDPLQIVFTSIVFEALLQTGRSRAREPMRWTNISVCRILPATLDRRV